MLCIGLIHGDLSEYNVLVAPDGPVVIDFPQVVSAAGNNAARRMLQRDVNNLTLSLGRFARAVAPAQAVAISTQSSLASLPAMLKASTELGASPATAGIVLPLSVAVFRATSPAMNLAVALYVAHWLGLPIGPGQMAAGVATARGRRARRRG